MDTVGGLKELCFTAPEDCVAGAAGFQRDAVTHFVADVDVHLISHSQGEIYGLLCVDLRAHHHAMLELVRQAELSTPLRNLFQNKSEISCLHHTCLPSMCREGP